MTFKQGDKVRLTFKTKIKNLFFYPEKWRNLNKTLTVSWSLYNAVMALAENEEESYRSVYFTNEIFLVRTKKKKLTYKDFLRDKNET